MARTKRRTQQWLIDHWYFGDFDNEEEYNLHKSIVTRDVRLSGYLHGIPRYVRNRFNRRNRYYDRREIQRIIKFDDVDERFSKWVKDAGYWWY